MYWDIKYLREKMQTVRGVNEVHGIVREKPSVETPRRGGDEARPELGSFLFLQPLMEAGKQWLEDSVEVVPGKIVEEHLEGRRLQFQALASCVDGVDNFGRHGERVGAGGATQVCYS